MSIGMTPQQLSLQASSRSYCEGRLSEQSIYRLLYEQGRQLFPDEEFADLFCDRGRQSIPPQIVATVMVLQRIEGLSDREAVERFSFDLRWKHACGGLDYDYPSFKHSVLVDMRARLRDSERPDRVFERVLQVCRQAGLVGRKRVLDSTALYDAVSTQDTVTLIRAAIRGLLKASDKSMAAEIQECLSREDDYAHAGKPACDWEDREAREALVDALARDGYAALAYLQGKKLSAEVCQAMQLLAQVLGQDLDTGQDGTYRIARKVNKDRILSTVDPEARHGHKSTSRKFDGYKGHISVDPDSEIIVASDVTAGNVGDAQGASGKLVDEAKKAAAAATQQGTGEAVEVFGDASYGAADLVQQLEQAGIASHGKVQAAVGRGGIFSKDKFDIDLTQDTVTCPQGIVVPIRRSKEEGSYRFAKFGAHCESCPLRSQCTDSKSGRNIRIHEQEELLQRHRRAQQDPAWKERYRATRPKVERKFGHLMRRKHGGRRARVRGRERVGADFSLLCAAENLRRLAALAVLRVGDSLSTPPMLCVA